MRKFRFTGNPDTYNWDIELKKGGIYPYDIIVWELDGYSLLDVLDLEKRKPTVSDLLPDWEEVFQSKDSFMRKYPLTPNESFTNLAIVKPVNEEKFINDCAVHAMNSWLRMQGLNFKRIAKDSFDMAYAMNEERKRRFNE